jgi:hypothetical protein
MLDVLRALGPALFLVAAALVGSRRRVIRRFEQARAFSEAAALAPGSPRGLHRWWLARLTAVSVLQEAPGGAVWLDRNALAAYRSVRRRRALLIAGVLLAVVAAWWWMAAGDPR